MVVQIQIIWTYLHDLDQKVLVLRFRPLDEGLECLQHFVDQLEEVVWGAGVVSRVDPLDFFVLHDLFYERSTY